MTGDGAEPGRRREWGLEAASGLALIARGSWERSVKMRLGKALLSRQGSGSTLVASIRWHTPVREGDGTHLSVKVQAPAAAYC